MTKKTRVILFLILVILFFLIAPQIILYSLGYRFDFERKKIVATGGLYLKVWPSTVEIFIDGKFKNKTGIILTSVLIQNLLPKKHGVLIKKEGYHSWQKTLEIKEKEVTRADNIILFKENPIFKAFQENTENFFFSPDEKIILLGKLTEKGVDLEIFDLKKENQKKIFSFPTATPAETPAETVPKILSLKWSPDLTKTLVKLENNKKIEYFILEPFTTPRVSPTPLLFLDKDTQEISFNPENSQEIFFIKNNTLYLKNLSPAEKSLLILKNLIAYEISENNIIWLEDSGFLFKSDFSGKIIEALNLKPFPLEKNVFYKIIIHPRATFLQENETLFLLNPDSKIFEKFYSPVKNLKFSPDSKKVLFFNDYEIWFSDLTLSKFEKIFLTRFSEKIEDGFWLNNYYLIFNVGNKIKISEIDTRDRINIVDLAEFQNPQIFWNQIEKKLYILKENTLFASEKLIP